MAQPQHTVRIIAGQYRRRLLPVPHVVGLRPTPDRVRQTVFNWLNHLIQDWPQIRVLDAFAGTGALGIEAASRGAGRVLLCEQNLQAVNSLKQTLSVLNAQNCDVRQGNVLEVLADLSPASMDLILLDPPFEQGWIPKLRAHVLAVLAPKGLIYIESEMPVIWDGCAVLRHMKAGAVHAQILQVHG